MHYVPPPCIRHLERGKHTPAGGLIALPRSAPLHRGTVLFLEYGGSGWHPLGGVGETAAPDSRSKQGDTLTKPELNHVHSTTWETCSYGDPDPGPRKVKS